MRRAWCGGLLIGLLIAAAVPVSTQPFPIQIQTAIAQLTTGVTPFTQGRITTSGYLNWGVTSGTSGYGLRDNAGVIQYKNSAGDWSSLPSTGSLGLDATYITQIPNVNLTAEQALSLTGTAILINTTGTGVLSAYAGTACTNQFVLALSATGVATCATVVFSTDTSGTVLVARGGTGLVSGTSGGILAFTGSTTLASSGALTANALVLGGGAGAVPIVMGSLGTTTTVLHGNAAGAPTFAAVSLTADVSGVAPIANGGTNSATALSGSTIMVSNGTGVVQGTAGTTTTLLHGNAAGTPTYSAVSLTADVTGILGGTNGGSGNGFTAFTGPTATLKTFTLPDASATILTSNAAVTAAQGGTGFTSYTTGDLLYADTTTTLARLIDAGAGRFLRSAGAGVAPAYSTTVWTNAATTGDLLTASATNTYANIAAVAAGQTLISMGVATQPQWSNALAVSTVTASGAIYGTSNVETVAATKTTTAVETGETYTNGTDTDGVAFTLLNDPAAAGLWWSFGVSTTLVSGTFAIAPSAGETLNFGTAVCASITATGKGSTVKIMAVNTGAAASYLAFDALGVWICT